MTSPYKSKGSKQFSQCFVDVHLHFRLLRPAGAPVPVLYSGPALDHEPLDEISPLSQQLSHQTLQLNICLLISTWHRPVLGSAQRRRSSPPLLRLLIGWVYQRTQVAGRGCISNPCQDTIWKLAFLLHPQLCCPIRAILPCFPKKESRGKLCGALKLGTY